MVLTSKTFFIKNNVLSTLHHSIYLMVAVFVKFGKADSVIIEVKSSVHCAHKRVAKNPEWSGWRRNVHSHECGDTLRLALVLDGENVVIWGVDVWHSVHHEGDVGHRGLAPTDDEPLTSDKGNRADGLVDLIRHFGRTGNERSSRIHNRLAAPFADGQWISCVHCNRSNCNLPVSLSRHVDPVEVVGIISFKALGIDATPRNLAADVVVMMVFMGTFAMDVKCKDPRVDQAFLHQLVVNRRRAIDRDGRIGKTHGSIEHGSQKGDAWLLHGLSKSGLLCDESAGVFGRNVDVVNALKSHHASGSVLNFEFGSVFSPGLALFGVVSIVVKTSETSAKMRVAFFRWNPQVC